MNFSCLRYPTKSLNSVFEVKHDPNVGLPPLEKVEAGSPSQEQHGKSRKRKRTQITKSTGKYDDLIEEAKKHQEEAEQALANARKKVQVTMLAVSLARSTREWLEKRNS